MKMRQELRVVAGLFVVVAAAIVAVWWWLGRPVPMPPSPFAAGEKLSCVSYAPFRGRQTPFDASTRIDPAQIDDDFARLARLTGCVRTYSIEMGLDRAPEIARRHGLKLLLGVWISGKPARNRIELETAIALAQQYADVIIGVVVGNEVLLRGELSAGDLGAYIREVKTRVPVPVTYADVWEFWERNRALADLVDFVTVHILPYWEDFPIDGARAAAHIDSIRRHVGDVFAGRDILIGETGWPSAGRMREGALPSPSVQARVIHEVVGLAKRAGYRINVIEAFDQPWKRVSEGTVGGHWGFLDGDTRQFKFVWGEPVSDHPHWQLQAVGGVMFAALVFGAAAFAHRRVGAVAGFPRTVWAGVALCALVPGVTLGWAVESIPLESLGAGGWARSLALAAVGFAAPVLAAMALVDNVPLPGFADVLGAAKRPHTWLERMTGLVLIALTVLAVQVALGLVFDPRYRDFPFAALTAAAAPFLVLSFAGGRLAGRRDVAEVLAAGLLASSAVYVAVNETFANWQSLWLCGVFLTLAVILSRARDAQS